MPKNIGGTVGRGGRNYPALDVMTVQYLLNCVPAAYGGASPELAVDGAVGPKTIAAIEKFQRGNGCVCDGRVDPGGATLRNLQAKANDPYPNQPLTAAAAKGPGNPFGQKGVAQPGDPFGQKGFGQPGGKGGSPADPFGQKSGGGMPPGGGGGFPFPQKGGGGAKGF
jgi:peptidoglycan hydrolase-like protein with peptidoglycan-binding domain